MGIMEAKFQEKEKIEDIRTELYGTNPTLRRPKNFSSQRRSDVYYFSDNSARGILKRVPVKNDSYRLNELETVLEKPDTSKFRNEIWSDVSLNSPGSQKASKNTTAFQNDDSYEFVHQEKKKKAAIKSLDETADFKLYSDGLKNSEIPKANKDYPKPKNEGKKPLKFINQDQKEESFYKQFKGLKKKKNRFNVSVPTISEKVKVCVSDEKNEKRELSASNMRSTSSKKPDERKKNDECLGETWTERSLNDALNMMPMKISITEL